MEAKREREVIREKRRWEGSGRLREKEAEGTGKQAF